MGPVVNEEASTETQASPSPSVEVGTLHRVPPEEARRLVDAKLGMSDRWPSPLVSYRLGAEWQDDWKVEVGQWLRAAA